MIFIIKIGGIILSIFSLFNLSLLHFNYNLDIINEINNYINEVIKWIKNLISKWYEEEEIFEPKEIFINSKREVKIIEKIVQPNNQTWTIPFIIIGGIALYCFNPDINGIIDPIISKIEDKMPINYTAFISGIFVYKFIAFTFTKVTGFKLGGDDNPDDIPGTPATTISDYFPDIENPTPVKEDVIKTAENMKAAFRLEKIRDMVNESHGNAEPLSYEEAERLYDEMQTPKASTSKLPYESSGYPPKAGKNPFDRKERFQDNFNSNRINISDESLKDINPGF